MDNNNNFQQYGQNPSNNGNNYQQYGQNPNNNGSNFQQYGQNPNNNGNNYQQYNQTQTSYAGNYQQPVNFQQNPVNYTDGYQPIKKKTPSGLYIILIAVVILFAVIIISMSAVMRAMMDGGDKKDEIKNNNDNILISDTEENTDKKTDSEDEEDDEETEEDISELSVPDISRFQKTPDKHDNGVTVYVTWNAVENADGYEIEDSETENDSEPYRRTIYTSDNYFETGASVPINIQVRVRAYKNKDDGKIYSGWSEVSECNLSDFMKNIKVSSTPIYYVKINNYHLPIYKDANPDNPTNDYINDRGTYTITERQGHWGKLKNGSGWINLDDADNFGNTYGREKAYISTEKDPLTIRYAPLIDSKAQGYIPRGENIYIYYIDIEGWYYVRYKDADGFIDKRYVTLGKAPDKFESYKLQINNYNLPVYKEAKYKSKITTHIRDREIYTIVETDDDGKWGKLLSGDGWINLSDANKFGSTGTKEKAYVTTKSAPLSLRQGPDMNADVLTEIPKGEIIEVCEIYMDDNNPNKASKEWYYVRYNNKEGFVSAKYVTLGEPPETETTTEQTETETTTEKTEPPVTEPPETEPPVIAPPVTEPPETEPPVIDTPVDTPVIDDEGII